MIDMTCPILRRTDPFCSSVKFKRSSISTDDINSIFRLIQVTYLTFFWFFHAIMRVNQIPCDFADKSSEMCLTIPEAMKLKNLELKILSPDPSAGIWMVSGKATQMERKMPYHQHSTEYKWLSITPNVLVKMFSFRASFCKRENIFS